jgi:hypothetical protein
LKTEATGNAIVGEGVFYSRCNTLFEGRQTQRRDRDRRDTEIKTLKRDTLNPYVQQHTTKIPPPRKIAHPFHTPTKETNE